jgi:hypothetical protein
MVAVADYRIEFLEPQHRMGGRYVDVVDYLLRVSTGAAHQRIAVGIPGLHEKLSNEDLKNLASAWLAYLIDRKKYDPFAEGAPKTIDVPPSIIEYWTEHRTIPSWL